VSRPLERPCLGRAGTLETERSDASSAPDDVGAVVVVLIARRVGWTLPLLALLLVACGSERTTSPEADAGSAAGGSSDA
jgi:hypothetical protein